jgi:hypothetical protein
MPDVRDKEGISPNISPESTNNMTGSSDQATDGGPWSRDARRLVAIAP